MVAAAVHVGIGKQKIEIVTEALSEQNNALIPIMAPPHGLYLSQVLYENQKE